MVWDVNSHCVEGVWRYLYEYGIVISHASFLFLMANVGI